MRISSITGRSPFQRRRRAPRHPSTGSSNLATSRSVKGACVQPRQPHRLGAAPHLDPRARAAARPCAGRRTRARPPCGRRGSTSTASTDWSATTTSGRANSACALIGTISSASTSGHTTGPPAENAYAVDPVGVAHDDAVAAPPRQRPAVDLDARPRASAPGPPSRRSPRSAPRCVRDRLPSPVTRDVERHPLLDRVLPVHDRADHGLDVRPPRPRRGSPTWPRLTPSSGTSVRAGELGAAQDRAVAAQHHHQLAVLGRGVVVDDRDDRPAGRSRPGRRRGRARLDAGIASDAATRRASCTASGRPPWVHEQDRARVA